MQSPLIGLPGAPNPNGRCPKHSMVPMAYKWLNTPDGYLLALVQARCFECDLVLMFNPGSTSTPPKSEHEMEQDEKKLKGMDQIEADNEEVPDERA